MNFKEVLEHDLEASFLNESEFAKQIDLDGRQVNAIMEEVHESIKTGSKGGFSNTSGLGLFSHDVTLYIKESDMDTKPSPEDTIYIDDYEYTVSDAPNAVVVENGLLVIKLVKAYS